jgi:hypothetical protein
MAFETLAERFEARANQIYGSLSPRTDDSGQPFVSVKPNSDESKTRIKNDIRLVPFSVSANRDVTRISRFLKSSEGVAFLTKQTAVQLLNTFENAQVYATTSVLANVTVPTSHVSRISSLAPTRRSGLLQNATVNSVSSKFTVQNQLSTITNDISRRQQLASTTGIRAAGRILRSLASVYINSEINRVKSRVLPQYSGGINGTSDTTRPEFDVFNKVSRDITTFSPKLFLPQSLSDRSSVKLNATATAVRTAKSVARTALRNTALRLIQKTKLGNAPIFRNARQLPLIPSSLEVTPTDFLEAVNTFTQKNIKNQYLSLDSPYFNEQIRSRVLNLSSDNASDIVKNNYKTDMVGWGKTNLNDEYNSSIQPRHDTADNLTYSNISGAQKPKSDIVKFVFTDSVGTPTHFRALISNIKEHVKPEFNEQRYIGRTERFVTYGGVKRSVDLTFNIVAFSEAELNSMWERINYLTGLAFPRSVSTSGFIVPPLFKITVGGIYDLQPCYIESLDYDMLDETITFDIDREVSQTINVSMTLSLLEKRTKFYNSPFYKINEPRSTQSPTVQLGVGMVPEAALQSIQDEYQRTVAKLEKNIKKVRERQQQTVVPRGFLEYELFRRRG